ncbi:acyl carrier protein [Mycobacterium sp. 050134]|uniref:acyl carrier protein n=1 Tax=Mycobacterium sp. 050134 TaxID=3096111 RepID=UPI002EDB626A
MTTTVKTIDHQALADWLIDEVARLVGLPTDAIGVDTPLADYGLDSAASLALCADLEDELGIVAETTVVWDYPTVDAIAEHLAGQGGSS